MLNTGNYKLALLGFGELASSYFDPREKYEIEDVFSLPLTFGFNISYRWNIEKEVFGILVDYQYQIELDEEEVNILSCKLQFDFKVEELGKYLVVKNESEFELNQKLESTLVSIAYSTGRGFMYAKTSSTILNGVVIPLINPNDHLVSKNNNKNKKMDN